MTVADILDAAADLIEPEGAWAQGTTGNICGGRNCASTAIDEVYSHQYAREAQEFFADMVNPGERIPICRIWDWNDVPERTQAEVVAKLREAAERARTSS